MGLQTLSFQVRAFLTCCNLTDKCLVSISSGHTHNAQLYVRLPTAQWWCILLVLKRHKQTEH
jgi:hypothetical protein